MPSGPEEKDDTLHLFALLTAPCPEKKVLVVNATTIHPDVYYDQTCVIQAGEHVCIKHPTYVYYRFAEVVDGQSLIDGAKDGIYIPKPSLEDDLYERICDGLLDSEHTPAKVLQYWEKQFA